LSVVGIGDVHEAGGGLIAHQTIEGR
jgi:hypothetical protein